MNFSKYIFLIIIFLIVFNSIQFAGYGESRKDIEKKIYLKKKDLKKLNKNIQKKKKEIKKIGMKEVSIKRNLRSVKKSLSTKNKKVVEEKLNILKLNQIFNANNLILRQLVRKAKEKGKALNQFIFQEYALGINQPNDFLFSPFYHYLCLNKKKALKSLVLNNFQDIECLVNLIKIQKENKVMLSFQRNLFQNKLISKEEEVHKIKRDYVYKTKDLNNLQNKKLAYNNSIDKLERSSKKLKSLINFLQKKSIALSKEGPSYIPPGKKFSELYGKLNLPLKGKIIGKFGTKYDPIYNTKIFNKGIEIVAPCGSKLSSIYYGRVLYSDYFKGFGKVIIIDHGGSYYSLMANIESLYKKVGDEVKVGEVIGVLGENGNSKQEILYFEIRHKGLPKNPLKWFKK
jgi:septal ring factor EnvC (AmiA/AmiB activator)